jgi:hypothetical protein
MCQSCDQRISLSTGISETATVGVLQLARLLHLEHAWLQFIVDCCWAGVLQAVNQPRGVQPVAPRSSLPVAELPQCPLLAQALVTP